MLAQLLEIDGTSRSRPMEGLRGVAVGLVFLQHYCTQFLTYAEVSGPTRRLAEFFHEVGNYGVELFFVLSGFLIYGILLRRRPKFLPFMARRAQRLYPAFIVAFLIGVAFDWLRPEPKIPHDLVAGSLYIAANIAFLPGLFPINPLFAVNWSLSYEWWFYLTATILFSVLGLAKLPQRYRICLMVGFATALVALSFVGLPGVPIRGLPFFGGMLLAEAALVGWRLPQGFAIGLTLIGAASVSAIASPPWACELMLTVGFTALVSISEGPVARALSQRYLRWFGNMSYSYYLVHAFAVLLAVHAVFRLLGAARGNLEFWLCLAPTFVLTLCVGGALFLLVEKPYSIERTPKATQKIRLAA
jgi:exopolysaccharide production protein ExoZ